MTKETLAAAALFYLSRYASSSGNLRRVLARKAARSAQFYGDDLASLTPIIDVIVAQHVKSGAVNDTLYAESQVRQLRRRGGSSRAIVQRLAAKGVPACIVTETAPALQETGGDAAAAMLLARRRRLGPFRMSARPENRQRDMAVLGRAGFGYQIAATVIDADDPERLLEMIEND